MSDKKVGRAGGRPITPTQKMEAARSDPGTVNVADIPHDKGKSAVADNFREREEKWRREQAMHDQQAAQAAEQAVHAAEQAGQPDVKPGGAVKQPEEEEGGGA